MAKKSILYYETPDISALDDRELHPILKRIYLNRGICSPTQLDTDLKNLLPFKDLLGIHEAAILLYETIRDQQRILIVGDYDVDGATSTALMVLVLRSFGALHVDFLVPNRFLYGYGLTPEIVALAAEKKADLIVTVDNGIASITGVSAANEIGIKVLITDHHLPGNDLPAAKVIVNPNQPNDIFPSKNLAGVGVAFYVLSATRGYSYCTM